MHHQRTERNEGQLLGFCPKLSDDDTLSDWRELQKQPIREGKSRAPFFPAELEMLIENLSGNVKYALILIAH